GRWEHPGRHLRGWPVFTGSLSVARFFQRVCRAGSVHRPIPRCCRASCFKNEPRLCYNGSMKRDEIINTLKAREADLRAHGVLHAALFGSVARDEQRPDSDIDILVDLDPAIVVTMFDYAGIKDYVASLFSVSVDVIDREALKPRLRPRAAADAI